MQPLNDTDIVVKVPRPPLVVCIAGPAVDVARLQEQLETLDPAYALARVTATGKVGDVDNGVVYLEWRRSQGLSLDDLQGSRSDMYDYVTLTAKEAVFLGGRIVQQQVVKKYRDHQEQKRKQRLSQKPLFEDVPIPDQPGKKPGRKRKIT